MESSSDDDEAQPHESGLALAEDGTAEPYVAQCASGGLGLFARGKPKPIEYKRDPSLPNGGFLSAEQADTLWSSQSELSAQYLMEVGLDTQWYRDEVTAEGALRPVTHISSYADYGQRLDWDEEAEAMVLVERGHRNIYIPVIDPDRNPAAFANDACFGRADPADDAEKYDWCVMKASRCESTSSQPHLDIVAVAWPQYRRAAECPRANPLSNARVRPTKATQSLVAPPETLWARIYLCSNPCAATDREDGKLWWSSVWLYPRADWSWHEHTEQEICFAYNWPVRTPTVQLKVHSFNPHNELTGAGRSMDEARRTEWRRCNGRSYSNDGRELIGYRSLD
jgi:hypothetical protein